MEKTTDQKLEHIKNIWKRYWWSYALQMACFPYRVYVKEKVHRKLIKQVSQQ